MKEDADLDSEMLSFVRCPLCLEIAVCVCVCVCGERERKGEK